MDTLFILIFFFSIPTLIIGLLDPRIISKLVKKELTRKTVSLSIGGLMFFSFFMIGLTAEPITYNDFENKTVTITDNETQKKENLDDDNIIQNEANNNSEEQGVVGIGGELDKTQVEEAFYQGNDEEEKVSGATEVFLVTNVVDGDTIDVNINGTSQRLRLIGLDTPETKDPRKPVQCFGQEASDQAVKLLLNKKVRLETDPTQGELDKYNRLLRYVIREDGLFFNKWMIQNGYAHEYTYDTPYKYQQEFKGAEKDAQNNKLGLWADNVCDNFNLQETEDVIEEPVITQEPVVIQTQPAEGCVIKGNISSDDRKLYHTPDCPSYSRTKIDETKGEKWFCTQQEAVGAGWTMAGNC
ncbi:MAG: thermonuclease family protein [Candidatus Magasanikbacteria bacterium]|nr:thermonuclease family protein [Candidatus Magasanikbacteria bacterium]MBT4315048.1 thermonuclease family protein [Candidatus Magasanikbacteria bacterium]MBT4546827.1 thermonuclease family protein [Candidatus Magasanikbacteria bacterium]MBT6818992.1 thermonuclease family protein [Candidatus Magasanikbacteria bacterium]